jgi:branched-chain amino acid transport system substrate-binding protein
MRASRRSSVDPSNGPWVPALRRRAVHAAGVAVVLLIAVACAPPGGQQEEAQEGQSVGASEGAVSEAASDTGGGDGGGGGGDTIRIGFIAPLTGTVAAPGTDMRKGWEFYWEQHGTEVAGRQVESFIEDDTGDPAVALNRVQRMVGEQDVQMVVGPVLANVALAVAEYLVGEGVPSIQAVAAADDLTQREFDPLVLRLGATTSSQPSHPAGEWAYEQGHRTAVTICPDYAFGHESCGGFARTFKDAGGEVVEQLWNPLGTQDFSSYMAQIQAQNPDIVYVGQTGGDAVRFVKAWSDFGLKDQLEFLGNSTITEQAVLRGMGPEALGLKSFSYYAEGREEAPTQEFIEAYSEANNGEIPSLYSAGAYTAAQWITQAIEEVDGDLSDIDAFVEAARSISLETPLGPMRLDEYNNPIYNAYLREVVERDDGTKWNVPLETYEEVSQFWTYDPQEYLENPVYSRDFQG